MVKSESYTEFKKNKICFFGRRGRKVPSIFVTLDTLPLTPNGKVNRRALPQPDQTRPDLADAFIAPSTEVEERLAQIWSQVLGVNHIGINDDFFELGGHSLLVTQVMAHIRDAFAVDLPVRIFFETPMIAALATVIEEHLIAEIEALTDAQAERLITGIQ